MAGPERIVSLCPSNTEIVAALGLLPRLVGIDDYSDFPPEVAGLPRVGPDLQVDLERVAALRPDLVLASLSVPGMEQNVQGLAERGLPTLTLDPHSLAAVWESMRSVARAAGVPEAAEAAVAALQGRVAAVAARAADLPRPQVYWEWWPKPVYTPGGRNWLTDLTALAGGSNCFAGYDVDNVRLEPAAAAAAQPEVMLTVWCGVAAEKIKPAQILERPGWEGVPAVRSGQVYILSEGLYCRPSPRLVDGLELLAGILHPEAFPEFAPAGRHLGHGGGRFWVPAAE